MAWIYLFLAGLFEMGWPLGFKLAALCPRHHFLYLTLSVISMGVSGLLLYWAQKSIPMGTAYLVWTGIGGIGTVLLGILLFHDLLEDVLPAACADRHRRPETGALIPARYTFTLRYSFTVRTMI